MQPNEGKYNWLISMDVYSDFGGLNSKLKINNIKTD